MEASSQPTAQNRLGSFQKTVSRVTAAPIPNSKSMCVAAIARNPHFARPDLTEVKKNVQNNNSRKTWHTEMKNALDSDSGRRRYLSIPLGRCRTIRTVPTPPMRRRQPVRNLVLAEARFIGKTIVTPRKQVLCLAARIIPHRRCGSKPFVILRQVYSQKIFRTIATSCSAYRVLRIHCTLHMHQNYLHKCQFGIEGTRSLTLASDHLPSASALHYGP